jgi:hypothetical protein
MELLFHPTTITCASCPIYVACSDDRPHMPSHGGDKKQLSDKIKNLYLTLSVLLGLLFL